MDLHTKITKIPINKEYQDDAAIRYKPYMAYAMGHQDARNAAATLAIGKHPDLLQAFELVMDSLGALSDKSELYGQYGLTDEQVDFIYKAYEKAKHNG